MSSTEAAAAAARSVSPRAQVREWLEGIGADRVVLRDGRGEKDLSVDRTVRRLDELAPTHVVIDGFGLRAAIMRGQVTVAILHTPSYQGTPIRWEKIA